MTGRISHGSQADGWRAWWDYFGPLQSTVDVDVVSGLPIRTRLFGFENVTEPSRHTPSRHTPSRHTPSRHTATVADDGACFGFVSQGEIEIVEPGGGRRVEVGPREFFCTAGGLELRMAPVTRVVVSQLVGHVGLRVRGGPVEDTGRLRYIDGCSDTVLVSPARRGDPCLNHLHFPSGVEQTEHHHPSVRTGIVARGRGWCETSTGRTELRAGLIFCIPANMRHRFITRDDSMDVIAFHPDSDFGPTDDNHPMINRTWVT